MGTERLRPGLRPRYGPRCKEYPAIMGTERYYGQPPTLLSHRCKEYPAIMGTEREEVERVKPLVGEILDMQ